jgi:predicted phage-related endonuclease
MATAPKIDTSDAAFRASVVGASEVAALFDCHPWLTRFELWNRKVGKLEVPEFNEIGPEGVPVNERAYWGVKMEAPIIEGAMERWGYIDREQAHNLSNGKGLGGHPDRRVICPVRGPGILETKMVDWMERKKWGDEPPLNYLLQNQTYQGLDQVAWGDVIVLVGGNSLERFQYDFRPSLYEKIEQEAVAFWRSVHANKPPKPDYTRDRGAIAQLFGDALDTSIDLRHDNHMPELAAEFIAAKEAAKASESRVDAAWAEIMHRLGENTYAMVEGFTVKAPNVKGTPDKIIDETMLGKVIKGRRGSRRLYVSEYSA